MSANPPGETRAKEREDRQGGGAIVSLSGGDERSEPESQIEKLFAVSEAPAPTEGAADASARSAGASAALPSQYGDNCIGKDSRGIGNLETGVAAKLLAQYAADPLPYLDPESKRKCRRRIG